MKSTLSLPKQLIVFDLDGVVYRGETPTPGAVEVLARLRSHGLRLHFLTNNSSQTRDSYCEKLTRMGIAAEPAQIMTSAYATALFLCQEGFSGRRILVVGEEGLVQELNEAGLQPVPAGGSAGDKASVPDAGPGVRAEAVVVGIDRSFTYEKLRQAQQAILAGALFVATNGDPTYPTEAGDLPGGGSIVAAIETASGRKPVVIGKPNTYSLGLILHSCSVAAREALMVGDRLDTDIDVGRRAGMDTVLTLTGVTRRDQAESAPASLSPTAIIPDLRELEPLLQLH